MLLAAPLSVLAMATTPYILTKQWGLYLAWLKLIGEAGLDDFTSRRTELWEQTIAAIGRSPLIGHGEGQFRSQIPASLGRLNHPHNAILQFLYQWGILGTAFLALMVVPTILAGWRAARADAGVVLPAAGAIVGLGAMSMLDGPLNYPFPIMVVIIGLAMIASVRPSSN
jgi:O-antigen ligase